MIIDIVSDLHGCKPALHGGDLLIVAGDLTKRDTVKQNEEFRQWIKEQKYKKKIVIAGNHDNLAQSGFYNNPQENELYDFEYLCDSGTEFSYEEDNIELEECGMHPTEEKTLKIWGSPWTKTFEGMNPRCKAFTCHTEEELAEKWALIPDDIDILITHGPSKLMHDETIDCENVGSSTLLNWVANHADTLKLHVYGHIHEGYGVWDQRKLQKKFNGKEGTVFVNCSHVNEHYQPVNKPVRVIL